MRLPGALRDGRCCAGTGPSPRSWIAEGIEYLEAAGDRGAAAVPARPAGDAPSSPAGTGPRPRRRPAGCWPTRGVRDHARSSRCSPHGPPADAPRPLDEATATLQELWTVAETCGLAAPHRPGRGRARRARRAERRGGDGRRRRCVGPRARRAVGAVPQVARARLLADRPATSIRACSATPDPDDPYAAAAAGDWRAAAAIWEQLGFPVRTGPTLADADDEEALLTALELADGLGAAPLAARVRARLRVLGMKACPAGRATPPGPTPPASPRAKLDVLELLARGADRRRDRAAARAVGADGQPPRVLDPGQARRPVAPRRRAQTRRDAVADQDAAESWRKRRCRSAPVHRRRGRSTRAAR